MVCLAVVAIASSGPGSSTPTVPSNDTGARFLQGGDANAGAARGTYVTRRGCPDNRRGLAYYYAALHEWRQKMGRQAGANGSHPERVPASRSCSWIHRVIPLVRERARQGRERYKAWRNERLNRYRHLYEKWRCIHEHEGAWNDPNPPYWGGLQMTLWFQQNYGAEFFRRWGTADKWPPSAQLTTAERAWRECSCFRQWGTAGMCGLS